MSAPKTILVVDDNPALRDNLAEILQFEGYEVAVARDGRDALARLEREPLPGIVLMDLMMPGMDGRALATAIRDNPRWDAVRMILTTGHPHPRIRDGIPVDAVLAKPFGVKELLAALAEVSSTASVSPER